MEVKIKKARADYKEWIPEMKTSGAACYDAFAAIKQPMFIWLFPRLIPLGIQVELPNNWELQVRPRSGLTKKGFFVQFGTVDSDYRGEIQACAWSLIPRFVKPAQRVAQLAIRNYEACSLIITAKLSKTKRNTSGFGSTGL